MRPLAFSPQMKRNLDALEGKPMKPTTSMPALARRLQRAITRLGRDLAALERAVAAASPATAKRDKKRAK